MTRAEQQFLINNFALVQLNVVVLSLAYKQIDDKLRRIHTVCKQRLYFKWELFVVSWTGKIGVLKERACEI
jgi:hypothetical protein